MNRLLIELEEQNIRLNKSMRATALLHLKWNGIQTVLFAVVGLFFFVIPFLGWGSWWYLCTVAVYWGAAAVFYFSTRKNWINSVWQCNRRIAEGYLRLRKLHEG